MSLASSLTVVSVFSMHSCDRNGGSAITRSKELGAERSKIKHVRATEGHMNEVDKNMSENDNAVFVILLKGDLILDRYYTITKKRTEMLGNILGAVVVIEHELVAVD